MKCTSIIVAMIFSLAGPASVLAEEPTVTTGAQAISNITSEPVVTETAAPANPSTPCPMHKMGMMHKGKGQQGKGGCGMMRGGGPQGKGMQGKHEQVVKRLDMIDARLAKIEAMLESLMRR